jgi:hypothetical protein
MEKTSKYYHVDISSSEKLLNKIFEETDMICKRNIETYNKLDNLNNNGNVYINFNSRESTIDSDNDDDIDGNDNDIDGNDLEEGISYIEYFKSIKDNTKYDIENADDIVFECSRIQIKFDHPSVNHTTFTVDADDRMIGFSRRELADKVLKYYHALYYINKHYNLDKGEFDMNNGTKMFHCCRGDYEYTDNNIIGLKYIKENRLWVVKFLYYN